MAFVRRKRGPASPAAIFIGVAGIVLVIVIGVVGNHRLDHPGDGAVESAARGAATWLEGRPVPSLGFSGLDVDEAVANSADTSKGGTYANHLLVTEPYPDRFEITNSDGKHPYCLTITYTREDRDFLAVATAAYTSVGEGRCTAPTPEPS